MRQIKFDPFANESESTQIGGMTVENRLDRVTLYGNLDITLDKAGYADALALKQVFDRIVEKMQKSPLPDRIALIPPKDVSNPFGA
jgi:hypothetical protein